MEHEHEDWVWCDDPVSEECDWHNYAVGNGQCSAGCDTCA